MIIEPRCFHTECKYQAVKKLFRDGGHFFFPPNFWTANKHTSQSRWLCGAEFSSVSHDNNNGWQFIAIWCNLWIHLILKTTRGKLSPISWISHSLKCSHNCLYYAFGSSSRRRESACPNFIMASFPCVSVANSDYRCWEEFWTFSIHFRVFLFVTHLRCKGLKAKNVRSK